MKKRSRLVPAVFVAVDVALSAGGWQLASSSPAGADPNNCENSSEPHCYAQALFNQQAGATGLLTGIFGQWHDNNMSPGASGPGVYNHIDSEEWFIVDSTGYVETGLFNGYPWWGGNNCGSGTCTAYMQFWGETAPNNGVQTLYTIGSPISPDGVNHSYQISRASIRGDWKVFLDGNTVGFSAATLDSGDWKGWQQQIGGELQSPSVSKPAGIFADTFDMYADGIDANGHFFAYGNATSPPNAINIEPGPPSSCFHNQVYAPSEYSWNKHC